jgi:hydroxymethylbilane synthase
MDDRPLTIGAHEGGLARAQADRLVHLLRRTRPKYPIHLEVVSTRRPKPEHVHFEHIAEHHGAQRTLHKLLRDGEVDVVIHRGFDLRAQYMEDLQVSSVLQRSSPYDALLSADGLTLDELETGTRVGITQLRTRVQLMEHRDDLELVQLSGDVGSWLTELIESRIEALVMPNAALEHLGLQERVCEIFPPELLLPAPGAGVLVCVTRRDDRTTAARLTPLNDEATAAEYTAEVAVIEALACRWESATAVLAQTLGERMRVLAMVAGTDGAQILRQGVESRADDPLGLGRRLAELLFEAGAGALLRPQEDAQESGSSTAILVAASQGFRCGELDREESAQLDESDESFRKPDEED